MRTSIVTAAAVASFGTILIAPTLSFAEAINGIHEGLITIFGASHVSSHAVSADVNRGHGSQARAREASERGNASPIRSAANRDPLDEPFTVEVNPKGPMAYLGNQIYFYKGLEQAVFTLFHDDVPVHFVRMRGSEKPVVDPKPPIPADNIFTNQESEDVVGDPIFGSYEPPATGPIAPRSTLPANPAVFIVALADSSINSDTALLIAGMPVVKGFPAITQAKLFRIQLTKISNGTHFCAPTDDAFISRPRVSVSNAGRLFVTFDANAVGSILSFDLAALVAGGPVKVKCFTGATLRGLTPPHIGDGAQTGYFIAAPILGSVIKRFRFSTRADPVNDKLVATPDINVTSYSFPHAAVQPNGAHLYSGSSEFRLPSIQIGNAFWNLHTIDDGSGHSRIRLYKFNGTSTTPLMELTLGTGTEDDLFAPSFDVMTTPVKRTYVTFARTIASDATAGKATLMQAHGPSGSPTGWKSSVVAKSPAQITKTFFGSPCDTFIDGGCAFMANTGTWIDPIHSLVWSIGPLIITGDGSGKENNWALKGVGRPQ